MPLGRVLGMGRWGDGEVGRWEDGGVWGERGKDFFTILPHLPHLVLAPCPMPHSLFHFISFLDSR
ncbi:MAG: hypothetical protein FWK04_16805 [Nostoc sp. GBBB01]|nr:hypothetical protein [Nostoc sp. GBBB01]